MAENRTLGNQRKKKRNAGGKVIWKKIKCRALLLASVESQVQLTATAFPRLSHWVVGAAARVGSALAAPQTPDVTRVSSVKHASLPGALWFSFGNVLGKRGKQAAQPSVNPSWYLRLPWEQGCTARPQPLRVG